VAFGGEVEVLGVVIERAGTLAPSAQIEKACSDESDPEVTFTVKGPSLLTALGVPAITPAEDIESPGGNEPLATDHE
jgi:hypothetical protein